MSIICDDTEDLYKKRIERLEDDNKYLSNQNEELKKKLTQSTTQKNELEEQNKTLRSELKKQKEIIGFLENKLKIDQQMPDTVQGTENFKTQLQQIKLQLEEKVNKARKEKEEQLDNNWQKFKSEQEIRINKRIKELKAKYDFNEKLKDQEINQLDQKLIHLRKDYESLKIQMDKNQNQIKQQNQITTFIPEPLPSPLPKKKEESVPQNFNSKLQEQAFLEEQKKEKERQQKDLQQKKNTIKLMLQQVQKSHGIIEICFLLDITGSMDPYKLQASKCIKDSISQIKKLTQKETRWSVIGYQDFGELKQLGGKYKQQCFTNNENEVVAFLDSISCAGGGDAAEDIRGGIKQMVQDLQWTKQFKLAILICDAPTHGSRYNGGVSDRYPNEDIEDAITLLIEANIFFMVIQFNKCTYVMFEEIKKIYESKGKPELLLVENAEKIDISSLSNLFANLISNATITITQMNNKASKLNNNNNKNLKKPELVSAMENLCKQKIDPITFDKNPLIQTTNIKFTVFRIEFSNESLEKQIQNIDGLQLEANFQEFQEPGIWDCIRTIQPFAQGSVKQVFLMKKNDAPTELYVIKMPLENQTFQSKNEAIKDCKSHLIAQCLLQKFIKELTTAKKQKSSPLKIPNALYSNILILKDISHPNSFWIAERYFSGEFVKYNNNAAFLLNDINNDFNHFAQAFSYYSYFKSDCNYMLCDVQGVGEYLTDPAINTKQGNFDQTDMGIQGIMNYLGTYQGLKILGQKYLQLLDINIDY